MSADEKKERPVIAQKEPIMVEVEAGQKYFWCTCGKSDSQPFCDGSHKDTSFTPMVWEADEDGRKYFCGCKMTDSEPFCDGTHSTL